MSKTAFGGRELGEAFEVLRAMADDPDCTRVLTISGAMSIAKMGLVVCQMIDAGLVQIIISTGAIMAHGLSEAIGCVHYKHDPKVSDKQLYDWGYNRVYDTLEMESNLWHAQQVVSQVLEELDWSQPVCSWRLNREIGRQALSSKGRCPASSARPTASEVPVYRAGLHRFGTGPGRGHALPGQEVFARQRSRAWRSFAAACRRTIRSSIFTTTRSGSSGPSGWASSPIGGGVPRNWAQQVGPFHDIINMRLGSRARPCRGSATACGSVPSRCIGAG